MYIILEKSVFTNKKERIKYIERNKKIWYYEYRWRKLHKIKKDMFDCANQM